jgi:hypothetical protein
MTNNLPSGAPGDQGPQHRRPVAPQGHYQPQGSYYTPQQYPGHYPPQGSYYPPQQYPGHYPPQYAAPLVQPNVMQARDRAQYTRPQTGHSILMHLLFGWLLLWIPAIYYTISPNHYWHL